jgi:hypothetical protein
MKTLFVTGTGTGIGKTFVCCRLLEALAVSRTVRCLKPVITGFDPGRPERSDTALLLTAQGKTELNAAGTERPRERRRPKQSGSIALDGASGRLTYGASLAYVGAHLDQRDSFPFDIVRLGS